MFRAFHIVGLGAFALTLAACGGDSVTTPENSHPSPTPTPTPTPTAAVASVDIASASRELAIGRTLALTATARDSAGHALSGRTASWKSSAEAIAKVASDG